jgi:hypothetical protein
VTASGHVAITTSGAETRTLADPTNPGQVLSIFMWEDGGDCVMTAASAVNQAGNNTLTFDNAGEVIVLHAIDVGGDLHWRVLANDGVGLTTV